MAIGGDEYSYSNSFLAPAKFAKLGKNSVFEFDYYIIVDNLDNIRSKVISIYNAAPSNLSASNISLSSFTLSWSAPSSDLTYEIFKNDPNRYNNINLLQCNRS